MEYPADLAALARKHPERPHVAERFELYIAGMELANAFSELTDPVEQRQRFIAEEKVRRMAGKPPYPPAEKFLQELEAMPEAAGIALGLDRLVMLLTGAETIDEVVAFTPELL
jgi:lysyl-tRNA synthetase class 2